MNIQDNSLGESEADKTALYFGRLMKPTEVDEAAKGRSSIERLKYEGKWFFCGDVVTPMFELLRNPIRHRVSFRITGFKTSLGGAYGVLTHQVAHHQHRFLIPLYEPDVAECIAALRTQPYSFLLSNDNEKEAVVINGEVPGLHFLPLLGLSPPHTPDEAREVLLDFPMVISAMTNPSTVPPLTTRHAVHAVSLSVLMPSATIRSVSDASRRDAS